MSVRIVSMTTVLAAVLAVLTGCAPVQSSCFISGVRFYPVQDGSDGQRGRQLDVGISWRRTSGIDFRIAGYKVYDATAHMQLKGRSGQPSLVPLGHMITITVRTQLRDGSMVTCTPRDVRVPDAAVSPSSPVSAA